MHAEKAVFGGAAGNGSRCHVSPLPSINSLDSYILIGAITNVSYEIAKFLHITGVVMLMGNITVTAIWKFFADRTQRPEVLAFAQKLVTYTDWSMTVWGVVLLMAGGYFMVVFANWPLTQHWLLWSQALFVAAGLIWLLVLVPLQVRQARLARQFSGDDVGDEYRQLSRRWLIWGLISTVPLLVATWLMIAKPTSGLY